MIIYEFAEYRAFLKAKLRAFPKKGRGKSLELARLMRVHPSVISQVFAGTRNFTEEQAMEVCDFLSLSTAEATYFRLLVRLASAHTRKLKAVLQEELKQARESALALSKRAKPTTSLTDTERAIFYSSWIYSACRIYCSTGQAGRSPEEVAERFGISRQKALEVLEFLLKQGLCSAEKDKYQMGPQSTWVEHGSPFLIKHHANWRFKALQYAEEIRPSELQFTGVMSVSKADFAKIREGLAQFVQDFAATIKDSPAEEVAVMSLDLLWVRK